MKTLQECKDEVAKNQKCKNFQSEIITTWDEFTSIYGAGDELINEVAELYASQFREPSKPLGGTEQEELWDDAIAMTGVYYPSTFGRFKVIEEFI